MHILLTIFPIFPTVQVERICLKIKTSYPCDYFHHSHDLHCLTYLLCCKEKFDADRYNKQRDGKALFN